MVRAGEELAELLLPLFRWWPWLLMLLLLLAGGMLLLVLPWLLPLLPPPVLWSTKMWICKDLRSGKVLGQYWQGAEEEEWDSWKRRNQVFKKVKAR